MNENISVKEVREQINEYFEGAKHCISVDVYGCHVAVGIKYWDFKPEREVRHFIESLGNNVDIMDFERIITDRAMFESMEDLFNKETKVYYMDGDCLRMVHLHDIICTHAKSMSF